MYLIVVFFLVASWSLYIVGSLYFEEMPRGLRQCVSSFFYPTLLVGIVWIYGTGEWVGNAWKKKGVRLREDKAARVLGHRSLMRNTTSRKCIEIMEDQWKGTHAKVPLTHLASRCEYIEKKGHVVVYTAKLSFELQVPQMNFKTFDLVRITPAGVFDIHRLEIIPEETTNKTIEFIEKDYTMENSWQFDMAPDFAKDVCEYLDCPRDGDLDFSSSEKEVANMFLLIHEEEVPPFCDGPISLIKRHPKSFVEAR